MMVAWGTWTPTSTTVVATSTRTTPAWNAAITSSFSDIVMRPCSIAIGTPLSAPSDSSAYALSTVSTSCFSDSSISG